MSDCSCETSYEKLNELEKINIGDLVALEPETGKVVLAFATRKRFNLPVIGVCVNNENNIEVQQCGITDVNTYGLICVGDKLGAGEVKGKAQTIRYDRQEEELFGLRSIGKVIGLYKQDNKAKVLLDIE